MGTQTDQVKLVSVTPDAEKHMAYCARVSNPNNQENDKFSGLLKYCINHQHWSIFEQATMTLEINTTRGIAGPKYCVIGHLHIRNSHKDMLIVHCFSDDIPLPELRRQDTKNRQNSIDDIDPFTRQRYEILIQKHFREAMDLYREMLDEGIAKNVQGSFYH